MKDVKKQQQKMEILQDESSSGRERPWRDKKMKNQLLALAYDEINKAKASRLRECADWLEFSVDENGNKKLSSANFCRVRLCPICTWRRGLKIFAHTKAIMDEMKKDKEYGYIFLTLTVRNCKGEDLQNLINIMFKAWDNFIRRKVVRLTVKGWYRGLEITHNVNPLSDSYDTYHPHFHCVFAVNKRYFKSKEYIKQAEWTELWQQSLKTDYKPRVDIRKVKGDTAKAVSEVAKYAVKDGDYIIPDDWDLTIDTVRLLDRVLNKRRLVAYGGKFKELHNRLNLDDEVDGNLVLTDVQQEEKEEPTQRIYYSWNVGYNQYIQE